MHDGVQHAHHARGGGRTEPGMVVARQRARAVQRSAASGFSCSRGVIVLGSENGCGVAFGFILAPLPQGPRLPRYYLVGAVTTNPTPRPHSPPRGRKGTRTQTCRFGNAIAEGCCIVSSHAQSAGFRDAGSIVRVPATAAMRHRQPDGDSRHVPCLLDSGVGLRWFEQKGWVG